MRENYRTTKDKVLALTTMPTTGQLTEVDGKETRKMGRQR